MLRILSALALAACCAHAAAQETVSMAYDPKTTDTPAVKIPGACGVTITGVADARNNKETVGPVLSRDPVPWVNAALAGLDAWGYTVSGAPSARPGDVGIQATLIRAYAFHGPMRINGVVAMDTRIATPSGKQIERKYRAFGSKINMMNATDEFMVALNYAMNDLLAKLSADLKEFCAAR